MGCGWTETATVVDLRRGFLLKIPKGFLPKFARVKPVFYYAPGKEQVG